MTGLSPHQTSLRYSDMLKHIRHRHLLCKAPRQPESRRFLGKTCHHQDHQPHPLQPLVAPFGFAFSAHPPHGVLHTRLLQQEAKRHLHRRSRSTSRATHMSAPVVEAPRIQDAAPVESSLAAIACLLSPLPPALLHVNSAEGLSSKHLHNAFFVARRFLSMTPAQGKHVIAACLALILLSVFLSGCRMECL